MSNPKYIVSLNRAASVMLGEVDASADSVSLRKANGQNLFLRPGTTTLMSVGKDGGESRLYSRDRSGNKAVTVSRDTARKAGLKRHRYVLKDAGGAANRTGRTFWLEPHSRVVAGKPVRSDEPLVTVSYVA